MFLLLLGGAIVLQMWAWRSLTGRVRAGSLTRLRAFARYAAWSLLPLPVAAAASVGAVGLEEWLGVALVDESLARAVLPIGVLLAGLAALGSLCFGIRLRAGRGRTPI